MLTELWTKVKKFVRHNSGIAISIILAVILTGWFFGCQSKVSSIIHEDRMITEPELLFEYGIELQRLENELAFLEDLTEHRLQDLARQDAMKQALFNNAMLIAETGSVNPLGILSAIGTLFGIGAVIDNRRKDGLIKGLLKKPSK